MRYFLFSILFFCAACGGAVYTPPPQYIYVTVQVPADIGPAELQRASDMATNARATAFTQQTQDARAAALATATEESARATSTTSARETADTLMVEQTRSALAITQGAGQALATNGAAVHTAEADQTAAAGTPTAAALRVAVAATGTQLARQAETVVRRQALDDQIAAAWHWALVVLGCLFMLALGAAVVFGVSDLLSARAEMLRAQAARAQAEAMHLWIMQYGGRLFQLRNNSGWEEMAPTQLAAPMPAPEPAEIPSAIREVPVRVHGEVVSTVDLALPETPERLKVLHLLTQALAVSGPEADVIPSAPAMGMHPQDWQNAVNLLKAGPDRVGYVVSSPGRPKDGSKGRTRLVQPGYKTLGALRDGVKRGTVLPRPAPEALSPTPGNIQNVISE